MKSQGNSIADLERKINGLERQLAGLRDLIHKWQPQDQDTYDEHTVAFILQVLNQFWVAIDLGILRILRSNQRRCQQQRKK